MAYRNFIDKILKEANLTESGDLNNISVYTCKEFHQFGENYGTQFNTEHGVVDVDLVRLTIEQLHEDFEVFSDDAIIYNLGYSVNERDDQAKITDYKFLIKIMATICEKVVKFLNDYQPNGICIQGNTRPTDAHGDPDIIKSKLYRNIVERNIDKTNYHVSLHAFNKKPGFFIYR